MAKIVLKKLFFWIQFEKKLTNLWYRHWNEVCSSVFFIFVDKLETNFMKIQNLKPWDWLRYIDNIFFCMGPWERKIHGFPSCLNRFYPNLKFTFEHSTERMSLRERKKMNLWQTYIVKQLIVNNKLLSFKSMIPNETFMFWRSKIAKAFNKCEELVFWKRLTCRFNWRTVTEG